MAQHDDGDESFWGTIRRETAPPDETPCKKCGIEKSRHIGGRCGRYTWPQSNERRRGQAEPDDPRRAYPVAASKTVAAAAGDGPADLSRLGIGGLLDELRSVREPDRPVAQRSEAESRALAARQAAEFRTGIVTRKLWLSTVCG